MMAQRPYHSFFGLGGGHHDGATIVLERLQPASRVGGLVFNHGRRDAGFHGRRDAGFGAQERGTQLGDELFPRVVLGTERGGTFDVAVQARGLLRGIGEFRRG